MPIKNKTKTTTTTKKPVSGVFELEAGMTVSWNRKEGMSTLKQRVCIDHRNNKDKMQMKREVIFLN